MYGGYGDEVVFFPGAEDEIVRMGQYLIMTLIKRP